MDDEGCGTGRGLWMFPSGSTLVCFIPEELARYFYLEVVPWLELEESTAVVTSLRFRRRLPLEPPPVSWRLWCCPGFPESRYLNLVCLDP